MKPFAGIPWEGSLRWKGACEPGADVVLHRNAPWDFKGKKIVCWAGGELLIRSIAIANVQQLVDGLEPMPLQFFSPVAFATVLDLSTAKKGEGVELVLTNPTPRNVRFDVELVGLRSPPMAN